MLMDEELIWGIEQYGRWNMQEFVARSQEMMDVLTYLRAERIPETFKVMAFVTMDPVSFLRRTNLSPISDEIRANSQHWKQEF